MLQTLGIFALELLIACKHATEREETSVGSPLSSIHELYRIVLYLITILCENIEQPLTTHVFCNIQ
jgi:hypothetical protein